MNRTITLPRAPIMSNKRTFAGWVGASNSSNPVPVLGPIGIAANWVMVYGSMVFTLAGEQDAYFAEKDDWDPCSGHAGETGVASSSSSSSPGRYTGAVLTWPAWSAWTCLARPPMPGCRSSDGVASRRLCSARPDDGHCLLPLPLLPPVAASDPQDGTYHYHQSTGCVFSDTVGKHSLLFAIMADGVPLYGAQVRWADG